jgi:hypothetical protein
MAFYYDFDLPRPLTRSTILHEHRASCMTESDYQGALIPSLEREAGELASRRALALCSLTSPTSWS